MRNSESRLKGRDKSFCWVLYLIEEDIFSIVHNGKREYKIRPNFLYTWEGVTVSYSFSIILPFRFDTRRHENKFL
jgi:hypothetical protein